MSQWLSPARVRFLVVHCSDTPDVEDLGAFEIHQMHRGMGWEGIGYHRLIRRDGALEAGRPEFWCGAHVYGWNTMSLGVCLIGRHQFTDAQFSTLETLLIDWQARYPWAVVVGHRDFSSTDKTCPNFDAARWWLERRETHTPT